MAAECYCVPLFPPVKIFGVDNANSFFELVKTFNLRRQKYVTFELEKHYVARTRTDESVEHVESHGSDDPPMWKKA